MSDNTMTMSDVLKYAIRIEHESMVFYQDAASKVSDSVVADLISDLRDEEVKHESRLLNISVSKDDIEVLDFNQDIMKQLIENSEISENATAVEVLQVALEREKHTRDFYRQVSTLTNIDASVIDIFEMLFEQESGHFTRISKMLEKIL